MIRMAQKGLLIAVVVTGLAVVGCADDLYGECTISADSGGGAEQCLVTDASFSVSCVITDQIECQTGACGRYRDSDPFCTRTCQSDDDCGSGVCRQFVMHDEDRYCVAHQDLPADES